MGTTGRSPSETPTTKVWSSLHQIPRYKNHVTNPFEEALCTKCYPNRTESVQNRGATFIYDMGDLPIDGGIRLYAAILCGNVRRRVLRRSVKRCRNCGQNYEEYEKPPPVKCSCYLPDFTEVATEENCIVNKSYTKFH